MNWINEKREQDEGFTLIELLIAIVVVGVLSAVAIVGIQSLTNSGEGAACEASQDAARAAGAIHYANANGVAPADLSVMVVAGELQLSTGVTVAGGSNNMVGPWGTSVYVPLTNTFTAPCP